MTDRPQCFFEVEGKRCVFGWGRGATVTRQVVVGMVARSGRGRGVLRQGLDVRDRVGLGESFCLDAARLVAKADVVVLSGIVHLMTLPSRFFPTKLSSTLCLQSLSYAFFPSSLKVILRMLTHTATRIPIASFSNQPHCIPVIGMPPPARLQLAPLPGIAIFSMVHRIDSPHYFNSNSHIAYQSLACHPLPECTWRRSLESPSSH